MRIMWVYPNIWRNVMPLALGLFTALLKREGHDVAGFEVTWHPERDNVDFDDGADSLASPPGTWRDQPHAPLFDALRRRVQSFEPDLLAFSVAEDTMELARQLSRVAVSDSIPVLWGGPFPTLAPERAIALPEVQMICVGEGEQAMVRLCRNMSQGKSIHSIPNLWIKEKHGTIHRQAPGPPVDLNTLPHPDFSLFNPARFSDPHAFPLETHRGCPYGCTFCAAPPLNALYHQATGQRFFRKRSMRALHSELDHLTRNHAPRGLFLFSDTLLAWSEREFREFIDVYSDFRIPFIAYARPETISHARLQALTDVGLRMLDMGIQHGNEEFRRKVLKRGMTNQAMIRAFDMAHEFPFWLNADNMVGFPHETPELAQDTIRLNRRIKADSRACSVFVPYHGTALRAEAVIHGFLDPEAIVTWREAHSHLNMPSFPPEEIRAFALNFHHLSEAN